MIRAAVFLALAATIAVARPETGIAQDSPRLLDTESGPIDVEIFAGGLEHPWGAALLPDGDMLVTERPGRLRLVSDEGAVSEPIEGVPDVFAQGQGGLLDVALDPDFATNRTIYLSFAEERQGGAGTSVGRGRLNEDATALSDFEIIFQQEPAVSGENHFGARLAFAPDGKLFITLGERFDMRARAFCVYYKLPLRPLRVRQDAWTCRHKSRDGCNGTRSIMGEIDET